MRAFILRGCGVEATERADRRSRVTRALIFRVLPVLAMTIAAGVAVLKWHQVSLRADHRASIESVQAATEATIMMLSYNPGRGRSPIWPRSAPR